MLMNSEVQRYRAQFFQISGFCLMSPFGKIILDGLDLKLSDVLTVKFAIYFTCTIFLACLGIILAIHGMEALEERGHKWIQ